MKYKVYFEIYGKKMVATVEADAEWQAKEKVINKINFHKIEKATDENVDSDIFSAFEKIGIKL